MQDSSVGNPDYWSVGPAPLPASIVCGLTLLAFSAAWLNGLPTILQIPIAIASLLLGCFAFKRLIDPPVQSLKVDGMRVQVRDSCGSRSNGTLAGVPFVSPFFVGMRWRVPGRRRPRAVGIFRGQLEDRHYRRLCAALRQNDEQ